MSAPDPTGRSPELTITERPRSIVSVSARKGQGNALAAAVKESLGLDLPQPGRFALAGPASATWIQPDVWLLDGEPEAPGALFRRVEDAVQAFAAVVDQSHGRSVLHLTGPRSRAVLATVCRLDLHPRTFGPGKAAGTLVAHVPCLVRAREVGFDLVVGSTYARWLMEDLIEVSAAYAAHVVPAQPPHRSAMPAAGFAR